MSNTYQTIKQKFQDLEKQLQDPAVMEQSGRYKQISQDYAEMKETVEFIGLYDRLSKELAESKHLEQTEVDPEVKDMARVEAERLETELAEVIQKIDLALLPKDPLDKKNIIVELRAGAGGDEAALFAAQLFRMYGRYAERKGWQTHIISVSRNEIGGMKEVVFEIHGSNVYSDLKYESGVHRVQRVPVTEAGGRIHTSAVTVAVLPEVDEVELQLEPKDLRIDV
ncbi:MAG: PCRF domain-containing protein, partial [Patescibacteria group bacterium]